MPNTAFSFIRRNCVSRTQLFTVPAQTWKVVLVIPKDSGDDVSRVTCGTRAIAVIMPNIQGIRNVDWQQS